MCLAGNEAHDVPFSSELPQNFRGKASPPGKLAAQQTDRAGMDSSCGPFVRISILRIDLPSHPFAGVPEGEPDR